MEAENRNSIKDVMLIHNTNYITNNNIVLIAILTSIRYISQENIDVRVQNILRVNSSKYYV